MHNKYFLQKNILTVNKITQLRIANVYIFKATKESMFELLARLLSMCSNQVASDFDISHFEVV